MRILLVHNFYQQTGGEDLVVADEARLLASRGHDVVRYSVHNDQVNSISRLALGYRTIWSQPAYRDVRNAIATHRPEVVHVHNTLPLLSPSVYYAASAEGVPVVADTPQLPVDVSCGGLLSGRSRVYRLCREARRHGSDSSRVLSRQPNASAAVVTMLSVHRLLGTWEHKASVYIALTALARRMFIESGLAAEKLVVKPNFVDPDPGIGTGSGGYALFVGRLSAEKGIRTLLQAWRSVGERLPLLVVGDGPLGPDVAAAAGETPGVTWLGKRAPNEIAPLLREATCLVFPSECYETFGRVIVEAFATGTPVVAAGHGAAAELVADGITGVHFRPGDAADLAAKVLHLNSQPALLSAMRAAARSDFEHRFTADVNYRLLLAIYQRALAGVPSSTLTAAR